MLFVKQNNCLEDQKVSVKQIDYVPNKIIVWRIRKCLPNRLIICQTNSNFWLSESVCQTKSIACHREKYRGLCCQTIFGVAKQLYCLAYKHSTCWLLPRQMPLIVSNYLANYLQGCGGHAPSAQSGLLSLSWCLPLLIAHQDKKWASSGLSLWRLQVAYSRKSRPHERGTTD